MRYGFFKHGTTSPNQNHIKHHSSIVFINRQDMAIGTILMDRLISNHYPTSHLLSTLGLTMTASDLTSPASMTEGLYVLTGALKQSALQLPSLPVFDVNTWLIQAISSHFQLELNLAELVNNRILPKKLVPSQKTDITVHALSYQTNYNVSVQNGTFFEFLNLRSSHLTHPKLDQDCENFLQQAATSNQEQARHLISSVEQKRNQLLSEHTLDELKTQYLAILDNPPKQNLPIYVSYTSIGEALATSIATYWMSQQLVRGVHTIGYHP